MKYKVINKAKCYCMTINRAGNAIMDFYDTAFAEAGITSKQYSLLLRLSKLKQANVVEIAEYVNLERSTVTRNIKILISKGWVCDVAKENERGHKYIVTEKGKKQIETTKYYWEKCQKEIKELLGEERIQNLMECLYILQDLQKEK
ncbi:MAG: winged helix-turn-helix transcriptional regulator [Firmicutes bacterium]|nr:winged helix-turn-helix transcriptional regulator [Bacillota bacterium]